MIPKYSMIIGQRSGKSSLAIKLQEINRQAQARTLTVEMIKQSYARVFGYHYIDGKIFKTDEELEEYQRTKEFDKYINDLLEE